MSCADLACRKEAAIRLSRSMGLIADSIWLTDFLTDMFCDFGEVSVEKLDSVLKDAQVIADLLPLISTGIVKFRPAWVPSCTDCLAHFEGEVDQLCAQLLTEFRTEFSFDKSNSQGYVLNTGGLYDPPLVFYPAANRVRKNLPTAKELDEAIGPAIRRSVRSALWTGRDALIGRGAVFSNSKIGLTGLALREDSVRSRAELQMFDDSRSISVPWVSDLRPSQIVELRQEAAQALPMFRQMLSRSLAFSPDDSACGNAKDVINDLRQQCIEVRNELSNVERSVTSRTI